LQTEIEYQIVALNLTATHVAAIIIEATGVTVNPKTTGFLQVLSTNQLEATRRRLSKNAGWRRPSSSS
jgi:hypothetical protein